MNIEDIIIARNSYNKYLKERDKLAKLKAELKRLIENPFVKRYLEIQSVDNKNLLKENDMIRYSFGKVETRNIPNENKIYIYMGAYKSNDSPYSRTDILLKETDRANADYILYLNIDNDFDSITIPLIHEEQFEQKNTVLKFTSTFDIRRKYYDLQQYYFSQLLNPDLTKKNDIIAVLKQKINEGYMLLQYGNFTIKNIEELKG